MIEHVTNDFRRIKRLAPDWNLSVAAEVFYLVVVQDNIDVGVFVYHPCDQEGMLMHVELGENCRGMNAARAYQDAFDWMFENTDYETLHGRIPKENRVARLMARHVGGFPEGIDSDGLICYSINRYYEVSHGR